jgi:hypothetical protein
VVWAGFHRQRGLQSSDRSANWLLPERVAALPIPWKSFKMFYSKKL